MVVSIGKAVFLKGCSPGSWSTDMNNYLLHIPSSWVYFFNILELVAYPRIESVGLGFRLMFGLIHPRALTFIFAADCDQLCDLEITLPVVDPGSFVIESVRLYSQFEILVRGV